MLFVRPIQKTDLDDLVALNELSSIGLTTLPKDPLILEKKINLSLDSFKRQVTTPENELYFFVLEDSSLHKIIGMSAIYATTGGTESLYFFQKENIISTSTLEAVSKKMPILSPISYIRGTTEIGSLFLHPERRKSGLGKLLSLCRFHFMAANPARCTNSLYTELRGVIENNTSLFWEGVGKHFFNMNFVDAIELLKYGRSFISHFLPKFPIYVSLLPKEVQEVIGKTHPKTAPVLTILLQEGFEVTDEIDIFDAGPKLRAFKHNIRTIRESKRVQITEIKPTIECPDETEFLLSNERIDFRACISCLSIKDDKYITLTSEACEALQVGLGDTIRISPIHKGT